MSSETLFGSNGLPCLLVRTSFTAGGSTRPRPSKSMASTIGPLSSCANALDDRRRISKAAHVGRTRTPAGYSRKVRGETREIARCDGVYRTRLFEGDPQLVAGDVHLRRRGVRMRRIEDRA